MNGAAPAAGTVAPRGTRCTAPWWANVQAVAGRELRDALRSRWYLLYSLAFAALGLGVSYISAAGIGAAGVTGFARTSAGLVNLVILVVPLMSLTAGASSIASDRERGMLAYLLAQPLTRLELLLGKYVGLALAIASSIATGFGLCAVVVAVRAGGTDAGSFMRLVGLAVVLALVMLGLGLLISVVARRASLATGSAVFAWLALVFLSDLGMMAGTLAWRLRIETLFGLALLNPCQVFKLASLRVMGASLDVLGPVGLYADDEYGPLLPAIFTAVLSAWVVLPLIAAAAVFSRRSPT